MVRTHLKRIGKKICLLNFKVFNGLICLKLPDIEIFIFEIIFRDGHTPIDLVKECDQDVMDLLRGDSALLDAAKKGNLSRVQVKSLPI